MPHSQVQSDARFSIAITVQALRQAWACSHASASRSWSSSETSIATSPGGDCKRQRFVIVVAFVVSAFLDDGRVPPAAPALIPNYFAVLRESPRVFIVLL